MNLDDENVVKELRSQKLAETLSNLVGLNVTFKEEAWDEKRQRFKKSYVSKGIAATELEVEPVRHVVITFGDGTSKGFFSFDSMEILSGEYGEYGSIAEYLRNEASTLFTP
jgi:hypothetical protein